MNRPRLPWRRPLTALALWFLLMTNAHPEILYDNSQSYTGIVHSGLDHEFGDEIWLTSQSALITEFQFEYFAENQLGGHLTGSERAEVLFRLNDGPMVNDQPSPGTIFYDSGPFSVAEGFQTVTISSLVLPAPRHFTWTVEFTGFARGERAALLFFQPVTVGFSSMGFWDSTPSGWNYLLLDNGAASGDFSARVEGIPDKPPRVAIKLSKNKHDITLNWPTKTDGYVLEQSDDLKHWVKSKASPESKGDHFEATFPSTPASRYFRLVRR